MFNKLVGYITEYEDAVLVYYSVKLGYLNLIDRRLSKEEKETISSGDIYCFVESDDGMKRWTDGKSWSPSRTNGEFLLYNEVPKYFSKSSIEKRKKVFGIANRAGDPQIVKDKRVLSKKTINFTENNMTYHIINYYRPIFALKSISRTPFFISLRRALKNNPEIINIQFIKTLPSNKEERFNFLFNKYGILKPELNSGDNDMANRRKLTESLAAEGLRILFNHQKNETNISNASNININ